jgi:hypothetical protein
VSPKHKTPTTKNKTKQNNNKKKHGSLKGKLLDHQNKNLHSCQQWNPHQHLLLFVFLVTAILTGEMDLSVVLICFSFMTKDIEHFSHIYWPFILLISFWFICPFID